MWQALIPGATLIEVSAYAVPISTACVVVIGAIGGFIRYVVRAPREEQGELLSIQRGVLEDIREDYGRVSSENDELRRRMEEREAYWERTLEEQRVRFERTLEEQRAQFAAEIEQLHSEVSRMARIAREHGWSDA